MEERERKAWFNESKQWVEDFLKSLLAVKSESGNETEAFDLLNSLLDECELDYIRVPVSNKIKEHPEYSDPVKNIDYEGRSNTIISAGKGGKTVALNTHMDVVPPSIGQDDAYKPVIKDGCIYARGACDAKGQIAAAILALRAVKELGAKNTLTAHIVLEEEFGGNGTLALLEDRHKSNSHKGSVADVLVNLEPTNLAFMPSVRGAVWFDMVFHGIAGHAGSAANTVSAAYKAIAAVDLLRNYHAELYEKSKDVGRFKGVANPMPLTIGSFNAGVWPSMVPSKARIRGVQGFLPNKTKLEVMEEITTLFQTPETNWIGDGMEIRFDYRHNGFELPEGHFLNIAMEEAMSKCGLDPLPRCMTASTDAIFYVERGIPAVVFGPGLLGDAHSDHEKIDLTDVIKAAEVLYLLACSNLG